MSDQPTDHPEQDRDAPDDRAPSTDTPTPRHQRPDGDPKQTVIYILGFLLVMFGFGWGSIPLYRLVCKQLDPGGSSASNGTADQYKNVQVDESRSLKVRFTTSVQGNLPWKFDNKSASVDVHPGEKKLVDFEVTNFDQDNELTGKAVYDVNPPEAGQYFKKIECFCFKQQTLAADETKKMPLYFWMDPDIPKDIDNVTLAYTFFNSESSRERAAK
jgi:cytochrome c oxidase assembly protein subunit 11